MTIPPCGLLPLISPDCVALILGSYPSLLSLQAGEYYANPRNMFWMIMESVLGIPHHLPYKERISLLLNHKIGLWDVYASCMRKNSADARIHHPIPNDLKTLISHHPFIQVIFLNGREAEKGFKKFFPDARIPTRYLPSTSPAYAIRLEEKTEMWKEVTRIVKRL
ncbi:MAG TPA: DNA-deoxyinosine glycosylase [Methanospirillum sp.]|uniref:DNA-deoxyinosine glycosylase n=1 Tax=Methanospirillum sp. TaxID=45200 RepID=UPI002CAD88E4|nr:DNA-deoxyinosine glycosylase [Methanospirillum sp.]HOJ95555.1 DNA-deoxyinosine glycosylase [Methanospirillum sp.]HOL40510.1 DNA-deoxyinosine glycosylase [Methanospirillum sp.]HPP77730.1 DNA-deoxyinosine glycosylase [Methanospirillum sp.]